MTIEEKAQAYDEALERAREWSETKNGYYTPKGLCEEIFPELKESEGERIRKALIEHFNWNAQQILNNFNNKEVIAWLEKQGEQKSTDKVEPKFHEGDWVVNTVGDKNQVVKVFDDGYTLDDNTFLSNSWATEHYHLWTIRDAKDGDVLCSEQIILLFKKLAYNDASGNVNRRFEKVKE